MQLVRLAYIEVHVDNHTNRKNVKVEELLVERLLVICI
jgi:hypothetical protein